MGERDTGEKERVNNKYRDRGGRNTEREREREREAWWERER